jgi:hypothetical protein
MISCYGCMGSFHGNACGCAASGSALVCTSTMIEGTFPANYERIDPSRSVI